MLCCGCAARRFVLAAPTHNGSWLFGSEKDLKYTTHDYNRQPQVSCNRQPQFFSFLNIVDGVMTRPTEKMFTQSQFSHHIEVTARRPRCSQRRYSCTAELGRSRCTLARWKLIFRRMFCAYDLQWRFFVECFAHIRTCIGDINQRCVLPTLVGVG